MSTEREQQIAKIANNALGIKTLETRNSDSLDFHTLSVWCIRNALRAAYESGKAAAAEQRNQDQS
jgi:hypothetical protein